MRLHTKENDEICTNTIDRRKHLIINNNPKHILKKMTLLNNKVIKQSPAIRLIDIVLFKELNKSLFLRSIELISRKQHRKRF